MGQRNSWLQGYLLLSLLLGLTGCGFHLQGTRDLSLPFHQVYLQMTDPYSEFAIRLRTYLALAQVGLTKEPTVAEVTLAILDSTTSAELLSVNAAQQTRQYRLKVTVKFALSSPNGQVILAPELLEETQVITTQASQILANSNEINALYQQMFYAVADRLMHRLTSQTVRHNLYSKDFKGRRDIGAGESRSIQQTST